MKENIDSCENRHHLFKEGLFRYEKGMQGIPDRVPLFAQLHEFAAAETGVTPEKFYTDPVTLVSNSLEVMEAYGIDVPVLDYDVYNIEAEALGQEVVYSEMGMPDVNRTKPLIRDRRDLEKIRTPDFDHDGRFPVVLEMNRLFREMTGGTEATLGFCAPFSLAANIRGIERLLMDIYLDPEFARELFDRVTEAVLIPWIFRLKQEFPETDSICGSDASASIPIVNPSILRDWIIPYVKRLRDQCGPEVYVPNWIGEAHLKRPEDLLDMKLEVCPGFVEGQDPDVEGLGPSFYKSYATRKGLPLVLGVGAAFLALATPETIRDRVRHYIEIGGEGGRFALYLCNLGATTPPENVRAAVQAVRDFGVY
jgi:uroporphyrinogen decarboxylase